MDSVEADKKRVESVKNKVKDYNKQKSLIKAALSSDFKSRKILFGDDGQQLKEVTTNDTNKSNKLFDESDNEDYQVNFNIKEQFQGEQGKKLLDLQSRFNHDERFQLDERFVGDQHEENDRNGFDVENDEKETQFAILEKVLGKKITPNQNMYNDNKRMLRFDPSQPEHAKFEIKKDTLTQKKKKRKNLEDVPEEPLPEVSKEVFYQVTTNLKDEMQKENTFSLLKALGRDEVIEDETMEYKPEIIENKTNGQINPFPYDSSDDEEERQATKPKVVEQKTPKNTQRTAWHEPLFFKEDDYRLQEGYDFIQRISSEQDNEFQQTRMGLKKIAKAKIRNNERKKTPFKKKLGGNAARKMSRMKKAIKR